VAICDALLFGPFRAPTYDFKAESSFSKKTMTKIETKKIRDVLKKKQNDLEQDGNSSREALVIEGSADELDRVQRAQERDFALGGLDRNAKLLREVRIAIERVDKGTFGICQNCEKDISLRRLAAMPWTAFCIVCQEASEIASQPSSAGEELVLAVAD
jgi:DnaK suppressor protein